MSCDVITCRDNVMSCNIVMEKLDANRDTTLLLNTALKKYLHFEEDQKYEKVRQRPQAFCNSLIKAVKSWPLNRI